MLGKLLDASPNPADGEVFVKNRIQQHLLQEGAEDPTVLRGTLEYAHNLTHANGSVFSDDYLLTVIEEVAKKLNNSTGYAVIESEIEKIREGLTNGTYHRQAS